MTMYIVKTQRSELPELAFGDADEKQVKFCRDNNISLTRSINAHRGIAKLLADGVAFSIFDFDDELRTKCFGGHSGIGDPGDFYNKTPVDNLQIMSETANILFKRK